jgi:hypothetical protein
VFENAIRADAAGDRVEPFRRLLSSIALSCSTACRTPHRAPKVLSGRSRGELTAQGSVELRTVRYRPTWTTAVPVQTKAVVP